MDILLITVIAILVMYIGIDKDPRNPKNIPPKDDKEAPESI